jgi:lipoprotein-anchoring transpeptidase ErfK/SrfK
MTRFWLFYAMAPLLLGSATPPARPAAHPIIVAQPAPEPAPALPAGPVTAAAAVPAAPVAEPAAAPLPKPAPPPEAPEPSVTAEEWRPAGDGLRVVVSIPLQKAYVFDDGELVATSPVSTGKRGHVTPTGTFRILQKKVHHRSSKYDNAPMPYMQRLTWYGIALHAGHVPGYPASHGCIRLPRSFAKKLYKMTDYGTSVTVTKRRPKSAEDALNLV